MFRNDAQKCRVIRALLEPTKLDYLWTEEGPTGAACTLLEQRGGPLSHGEALMLFVCFDVWNGKGRAQLGELLHVLDNTNLGNLGTLLMALSDVVDAPRTIDLWLDEHWLGPRERQ